MSEEKPLFLIDVDRAIEGLVSSVPANGGAGSARLESSVMYCVDLANALDGAGLDALSAFASELSESFTASSTQAFLLIPDLVALVNAEASHIHSSGDSSRAEIGATQGGCPSLQGVYLCTSVCRPNCGVGE